MALTLYQDCREVDRVEIWGLRPANASCVAVPELRVLNKTTLSEPPLAVVAVKSTMVRNMTTYFQASGYTAARSISIRGLNPCDDYVVKLFYYLPSPSPWRITIYGDLATVLTTTETVTTTATATKVVTSTVTVEKTTTTTVEKTTTVTITETRVEEHTATVTHTVTGVEVVREVVLLAGSWGPLEDEVMRIGHMGVQASLDHLATAVTALGAGLRDLGIDADMEKAVDAVVETFR